MGKNPLVTVKAPTNIAVIKYWGKKDEKRIIPLNDSISTTLNIRDLHTKTSVRFIDGSEDELILNGEKQPLNSRVKNLLAYLRENVENRNFATRAVRIESYNSFPTAAGLASSASGYAALAVALCRIWKLDLDQSIVARMGSGSASRSVFGGWVRWYAGNGDSESSFARQRFTEDHWKDMQILVCVVSDEKKKTSSTGGMQDSVNTSKKLDHRWREVVPDRMKRIEQAIRERDFPTFASITMQDSDDFHDICETDTTPRITYMNEVSKAITKMAHAYNKAVGKVQLGYTYDAGPNAVLYCEKENLAEVVALLKRYFPSTKSDDEFFNKKLSVKESLSEEILKECGSVSFENGIKRVIHTTVGPGPEVSEKELA